VSRTKQKDNGFSASGFADWQDRDWTWRWRWKGRGARIRSDLQTGGDDKREEEKGCEWLEGQKDQRARSFGYGSCRSRRLAEPLAAANGRDCLLEGTKNKDATA
jgi:hypothetical protein